MRAAFDALNLLFGSGFISFTQGVIADFYL